MSKTIQKIQSFLSLRKTSNQDDEKYISGIDFRTLYITPENVDDSLRFVWDPTVDIDGDAVSYRIIGYQGLEFWTMDDNEFITDIIIDLINL